MLSRRDVLKITAGAIGTAVALPEILEALAAQASTAAPLAVESVLPPSGPPLLSNAETRTMVGTVMIGGPEEYLLMRDPDGLTKLERELERMVAEVKADLQEQWAYGGGEGAIEHWMVRDKSHNIISGILLVVVGITPVAIAELRQTHPGLGL